MIRSSKTPKKKGKIVCHYRGEIDFIKQLEEARAWPLWMDGSRSKIGKKSSPSQRRPYPPNHDWLRGSQPPGIQRDLLCEPALEPGCGRSGVARCHRIGQTEPVKVFRFKMDYLDEENDDICIEQYAEEVQEKKREFFTIIDEEEN